MSRRAVIIDLGVVAPCSIFMHNTLTSYADDAGVVRRVSFKGDVTEGEIFHFNGNGSRT